MKAIDTHVVAVCREQHAYFVQKLGKRLAERPRSSVFVITVEPIADDSGCRVSGLGSKSEMEAAAVALVEGVADAFEDCACPHCASLSAAYRGAAAMLGTLRGEIH